MKQVLIILICGIYLKTVKPEAEPLCDINDMRGLIIKLNQLQSDLAEYKDKTLALETELQEIRNSATAFSTEAAVLKNETAALNKKLSTTAAQVVEINETALAKLADLNMSVYELKGQAKEISEINMAIELKDSELNASVHELVGKLNENILTSVSNLTTMLADQEAHIGNRLEETNNATLSKLNLMNSTVETIKQTIDERIDGINATLHYQTAELTTLKNMQGTATHPGVGFVAQSIFGHFQCVGTVSFPFTVLNKGNSFNISTSHFTAPYSAMYMFSVQMCMHADTGAYYKISSTSTVFSQTYYRETHEDSCSCVTTVAYLVAGEQVYVNCTSSTGNIEGTNANEYWTMFSGALLQ